MELNDEFTVSLPVERAFAVLTDVERIAHCLPGAELQEVDGEKYHGVVKVKVGPITAQYKGVAHFLEQDATAHRAVLRAEGRDTRGQGNASATVTATMEPAGEGTRVTVITDLTITGKVAQFGRGVLAEVSTKLLGQFVDSLEATVIAAADGGTATPDGGAAGSGGGAATPARDAAGSAGGAAGGAAGSAGGAAGSAGGAGEAGSEGNGGEPGGEQATSERGTGDAAGGGASSGPRPVVARPAEPVDLLEVAGPSVLKRAVPVVLAAGLLGALLAWLRRARRRRG